MPKTASTTLQTAFGPFAVNHHKIGRNQLITLVRGDVSCHIPLIRLQSACLFGTAFHSRDCPCQAELTESQKMIANKNCGVIVYSCDAEGRGVGLQKKIEAMEIRLQTGCSTDDDLVVLGLSKADFRTFKPEVQVLRELGVDRQIKLLGSNNLKCEALTKGGFTIKKKFAFTTSWQEV